MVNVHRTIGKQVMKHVKKITIPYKDILEVLEKDGEVFLESDEENPLRRQTVWKAAKKLSQMIGKKIYYTRALLRIDGIDVLEGYSFSIEEDQQSANHTSTSS